MKATVSVLRHTPKYGSAILSVYVNGTCVAGERVSIGDIIAGKRDGIFVSIDYQVDETRIIEALKG